MERLKSVVACVLVGLLVVAVYLVFEGALAWSIDNIWREWLDTSSNRALTVLATVVLGMVYFAARHYLDTGDIKKHRPLVGEFFVILAVGFLSLFAGASLGPEAILIPAAMIVGQLVARSLRLHGKLPLFGAAGVIALFVAFFGSLLGGLLGLYLVKKSTPIKFSPLQYLSFALTALAALILLDLAGHHGAFAYPGSPGLFDSLSFIQLVVYAAVFAVGLLYQRVLLLSALAFRKINTYLKDEWVWHGLAASSGLALLFVIGGYYVQFTGNENIEQIFYAASGLGLVGVLWISLIKVITIAWSVEMGYRGGLIFPLVFVGSAVTAAATLVVSEFNFALAIFSFLAGSLVADRNSKLITGHSGEQ